MTTTFTLDPDAVLDFTFDWTAWLADGETIDTHAIEPTDGITVDSSNIDGGLVVAWVSGATGTRQKLTCRITTDQGRTDDRTITLNVRER